MVRVETLDFDQWDGPFPASRRAQAIALLEQGVVLHFPRLGFSLAETETDLLSPGLSDGKAKNISLDPMGAHLRGIARTDEEILARLRAMMDRFARTATGFANALLPRYAHALRRARTSFRPQEIAGRHYSPRKDDTLLHVDAFPSQPTGGDRILRLFTNINPLGKARVWRLGEPFDDFASRFLAKVDRPSAVSPALLAAMGITKGLRSPYDTIMLRLHDQAKSDAAYQASGCRIEIPFAVGSTWMVYTDQMPHAVREGQYALEQTFHVDVAAMATPAHSTLRILERMTGRRLSR